MHKIIYLDFNKVFKLCRGNVISKIYIEEHKGDYPVYSTQLDSLFGSIDSYMYEGEYLIWNTDGLAGYIRKTTGKFSITNIVGIMLFQDDSIKGQIDLDYLKCVLQPIFRANIKGRIGEDGKNEYTKLNSTMIKGLNIKIPIPINEDGSFDLQMQKDLVKRYNVIEQYKEMLLDKKNEIKSFVFNKIDNYNMEEFDIGEIFESQRGNSLYTKRYMNEHKGDYPVYTATIGRPSDFVLNYDYDYPQLTYITDGYAGEIEILEGKYVVGGHRAILHTNKNIDLLYAKYALKSAMKSSIKYGTVPSVIWNVLKTQKISIPVNKDGSFNIEAQKEIAKIYSKIDELKKYIVEELDRLLEYDIVFE